MGLNPDLRNKFAKKDKSQSVFKQFKVTAPTPVHPLPYHFTWTDIEFDVNKVRLSPSVHKLIFPPVRLKGSLPILNEIRQRYFERLHPKPFKLFFHEGVFYPNLSKEWLLICELIEPAIEFAEFYLHRNTTRRSFGRFEKLTIEQILVLWKDQLTKTPYIEFLASRQAPNFKVIPILEYQNKVLEESFIFRIKTGSGRTLIVWENGTAHRATHLFITDNTNHTQRLHVLESFITNAVDAKRSLLHDADQHARQIKKEIGYIETVNHRAIDKYRVDIQTVLNRY